MTAIYHPHLTLYAANQILSAMPNQAVYVGTHPPHDFPGYVLQYRHPIPFGVSFQANERGMWLASVVDQVKHQHLRFDNNASYVRDHYTKEGYLRDYERCAPTWPIEKWLSLGSGLHIFWYGQDFVTSFDQFRAFVLEESVSLEGRGRREFVTEAQKLQEQRVFFEKRMETAAREGDVDEHNVRVLEDDLSVYLSRPKRSYDGGRVLMAPEGNLSAAWNPSTGKLIGVLATEGEFNWSLVVPPSAEVNFQALQFSEMSHRLGPAFSLKSFKEIPLPQSLDRSIDLFNQKFGGDE